MIDRLTVLGPGTIMPLPDYGCSGYLLHWKTSEGERPILIDCGPGTLDRLCEHGTPVEAIEVILITHFHVDHVSDLAAVFLSRWLRNLDKGPGAHRLTVIGPVGLADHIATVSKLNQPWISEYEFDIVELGAGSYVFPNRSRYDGLSLDTVPTGHTENSICYRLTDSEGRRFFYSGDTDYNEALLPLADGAELAILECSMPDEKKLPGHLTPRLAGKLAEKSHVRRLLLTHFYEEVLTVDIVTEVRKEYGGEVELAKKLRSYPIS